MNGQNNDRPVVPFADEPSEAIGWTPLVFYGESMVDCTVEHAWKAMLDYRSWNPSFAGAIVTPVCGASGAEGEVVLIKKPIMDVTGHPLPEFYAQTMKLVPYSRIAWYVYSKDNDVSRNFVDFSVSQSRAGVRFNVSYYMQTRLSGDLLIKQEAERKASLKKLADAFKNYCEASRPMSRSAEAHASD